MRIIKGTNYWRLLSIILMFIIFLGLYYFFVVYPKDTEKFRLAIAEEIFMASYWHDLSYKHDLYKAMLKQNVPLNEINDEIYFNDLNMLRVLYQSGDGEKLIDTLNRYFRYSIYETKSVRGLCLKLQFLQRYKNKIEREGYRTERLARWQNFNAQNWETVSPWLQEKDAFNQFFKSKKMQMDCSF
ncbi:hypothetical protein F2A31_05485 [Acinetobacter suaedae]|uniref:DUF4760 domain-containing protein n=1 Tax=Acinetobacter suaedae TaxID=2609668 RepID=A0A5P1UR43_9GAMM|nr:hypothetical protein [Acinetobacter sp. C16S1]QER39185.1 hypothetical protein F2A31_05485 [Acinetobacter sp. C16S1]